MKTKNSRHRAPRRVLHLISQAHLDPVWLWPVRDGMAEALTTMQSAVDRAAEVAQFKFTRASTETYRWVKETDPVLYRRIQMLVKQGRWELIGGWIEQADCNIPSTESLIRQGLYGHAFFNREFGKTTRIGYNVDSFGHAGGLPQILKATGMDRYVYMRDHDNGLPSLPLLFWWKAPDGSRVLTQRILGNYSQSYAIRPDEMEARVREAATTHFAPGFDHGVFWFGVGNHGGGPTRDQIAKILELQNDPSLPELRFSTANDYFDAVEQEAAFAKLPVVEDELNFNFRGCYSATGAVKSLHRASEKALQTAEAIYSLAGGTRSGELHAAWRKLLFNEFHDIMAGTCIEPAFAETRDRFGSTLDCAREVAARETCRMARQVDTRQEKGSVLFALNPLPWKRTAMVAFDTFISPHNVEEISHLETKSGQKIPIQWLGAEANFGPYGMPWGKLTALVELPPGGYRAFRVAMRPVRKNAPAKPAPKTRKPALASLPIPQRGEALDAPVGVVVIEDLSGTWGHGSTEFRKELGRPTIVSTQELEPGPLVKITRQISRWKSSEIWMDVARYKHTPHIELRFRINWQEKRQIAKLEIPTRLENSRLVCKTAGGVSVRPANGEEFPCHDWIALEGTLGRKPATVALINDSSYSCDTKDGTLRMVLARCVPFAEHPPFEYKDDTNVKFTDQGWQEHRFWLTVGPGSWAGLDLERAAQEWQIPAQHMMDSGHPGTKPWEETVFSAEPATVSVLALKPDENGKGMILRLQEMSGRRTRSAFIWKRAAFKIALEPWEIITLRLARRKGQWVAEETDALERPSGRAPGLARFK